MKQFQPKSILITGGAGFIGSNFVRHLLSSSDRADLINLDKLTYAGSLTNLEGLQTKQNYTFVKGDICNADLLKQLFMQHAFDAVVHFAAETHVDRSITNPAAFIATNLSGTYHLLEAARCYWLETKRLSKAQCRFVHISTDEVYGSLGVDEQPCQENRAYQPNFGDNDKNNRAVLSKSKPTTLVLLV